MKQYFDEGTTRTMLRPQEPDGFKAALSAHWIPVTINPPDPASILPLNEFFGPLIIKPTSLPWTAENMENSTEIV